MWKCANVQMEWRNVQMTGLNLVIQQVKICREKSSLDNMAAGYRHSQIYSFYLNPEYSVVIRKM
jgi:hypothetical protein